MKTELPEYVKLGELFKHVSALRAELCLPPLKSADNMIQTLINKKVPFKMRGCRYKLYHLKAALYALTQTTVTRQPWNRPGTQAELDSREFCALHKVCEMFRCGNLRMMGAVRHLSVRAFRHPFTNRLWVHLKDAERVAFYRRKRFLYSVLPEKEADAIVATRPFLPIPTSFGRTSNVYFCPELSHLGSVNTAYKERK